MEIRQPAGHAWCSSNLYISYQVARQVLKNQIVRQSQISLWGTLNIFKNNLIQLSSLFYIEKVFTYKKRKKNKIEYIFIILLLINIIYRMSYATFKIKENQNPYPVLILL